VTNATYDNHGAHAEAVDVIFDLARITYREVLEVSFQIHGPSTRKRQGDDLGSDYQRLSEPATNRGASPRPRDTIADVDASGLWLARW
jgi:peptide-methionine (S)-S-oxide reductase